MVAETEQSATGSPVTFAANFSQGSELVYAIFFERFALVPWSNANPI